MMRRLGKLSILVMLGLGPAWATAGEPPASMSPLPEGEAAKLLAGTPNYKGVFAVTPDGNLRHLPSGLICPGMIFGLNLKTLRGDSATVPDGRAVCEYLRLSEAGQPAAQLVIGVRRPAEGETLTDAFMAYRDTVTRGLTEPAEVGVSPLDADDSYKSKIGPLPPYRSVLIEDGPQPQGYLIAYRDAAHKSDPVRHARRNELLVALQAGWVIEVRSASTTFLPFGSMETVLAESASLAGDFSAAGVGLAQASKTVQAEH